MKKKTDWELVLEYYKCNNEPVGELIRNRYYPSLMATAYRILKSNHDANDVIQELALKLCTLLCPLRRLKFKPKPDNVGYALRLRAKSLASDLHRKKKRQPRTQTPEEHTLFYDPEKDLLQQRFANSRLLDCVMQKLREAGWEREANYLELILEGKKLKEIAHDLGMDRDEARKCRQKALRQAKRIILSRQCHGDKDFNS